MPFSEFDSDTDTRALRAAAARRLAGMRATGTSGREDHAEAAADYVAARMGALLTDETHPLAISAFRNGTPFHTYVERLTGINVREAGGYKRALGVSDLDWTLATAGTKVIADMVPPPAIRQLTAPMEVADLKPATVGSVHVGDVHVTPVGSNMGEFLPVVADQSVSAAATLYSLRLMVPLRLIVNDQIGAIGAAIRGGALALLRAEARAFGAILSANPNVQDEAPLFGGSNTNATEKGISVAALDEAQGLLHNLGNAGAAAIDAPGKFWLVPMAKVATARVVAAACDGWPIVLASAYTPQDASFLFPDPAAAPSIVRLQFGSDLPTVDPAKLPPNYDGRGMRIEHGTGMLAGARACVKIPLT